MTLIDNKNMAVNGVVNCMAVYDIVKAEIKCLYTNMPPVFDTPYEEKWDINSVQFSVRQDDDVGRYIEERLYKIHDQFFEYIDNTDIKIRVGIDTDSKIQIVDFTMHLYTSISEDLYNIVIYYCNDFVQEFKMLMMPVLGRYMGASICSNTLKAVEDDIYIRCMRYSWYDGKSLNKALAYFIRYGTLDD